MKRGGMATVRIENTQAATGSVDIKSLRGDFPALHQRVHGKPLVYLDSAATTLKSQAMIDAVTHVYAVDCANIHRGVHLLSQRATEAYERVRLKVRRWVRPLEDSHVVFVRGTTEAINLVADAYVLPRLNAGDEIVITELEHHSNIVPWQLVTERTGAKLVVVPMTDEGEVHVSTFEQALSARTKFAAVAHVSNALGTVLPVRLLVAAAHKRGIPVLVDGAQAVAHIPVNIAELDADFYAFSAHKLYGPTGTGVLVAKRTLLEQMRPYQGGGDMIKSVSFAKTVYNDLPHKFEAGTPDIAGVVGLGAAIDYLTGVGIDAIVAHEQELVSYATRRLSELDDVRFFGTAPHRVGLVSFNLGKIHPHDVGTILDTEGVALRAGHHCAQPVMAHYGIAATVRASFGVYNDVSDVDRLMEALGKAKELLG